MYRPFDLFSYCVLECIQCGDLLAYLQSTPVWMRVGGYCFRARRTAAHGVECTELAQLGGEFLAVERTLHSKTKDARPARTGPGKRK